MDRRPLLALSPRRLRPRRTLRPLSSSIQSPPASTKTIHKTKTPTRSSLDISCTRLISSELKEMAKKVEDKYIDFDAMIMDNENIIPTFERGRFYELYSARRNQRLMKKKLELEYDDDVVAQDSGVVELSKKKNLNKGQESYMRRTMPANFGTATLKSTLRNSKEIKQVSVNLESARKSTATGSRRMIGSRSALRI